MSDRVVEGDPSFRVTLDGTGDSFLVTPPESILTAARRHGFWLPFECGWGSCSQCKASVLDGSVEVLFPDAPSITDRDARRRRYPLCQSTPASNVTIKPNSLRLEPTAERPTVDRVATLISRRELGPSIVELGFSLNEPATFRAGQYAIFHIGDGLDRCYSMSSVPGPSHIEFIIKKYAGRPGSTRMHDLEVGDELAVELPYGDMYLRDSDRPVLMIAGGTGISAILSLLRSITHDPSWVPRPVHVVYGAGSREELVCWDDVLQLTEDDLAHAHGALVEDTDGWSGHTGYVTTALTTVLSATIARDHDLMSAEVYLAGPPVMVNATQACLSEHGFALDRIHVDSFG